ncbi:MaoC family dehydratase [Flavobacteriaceae bacterium]|nr:MaoC family dehydratase [Flavobacteriaceae bacterium]
MGKINEGSVFEEYFSYSQEDVNNFAEISGDKNPIHIDEVYASKSIFGKRIIHGYLGSSIFSKVFAMNFPGEGTIYLKQDLKFLQPMFTDSKYLAKFTVLKHLKEKHRAFVKTEIYTESNDIVVTGEALIQNKFFL